jgi:hypothetical protein
MAIACNNGSPHSHETAAQSRACWTGAPVTSAYPPSVSAVVAVDPPKVSDRQLAYIRDLGGDVRAARHLTRKGASEFIDELIREKKGLPPLPTSPTPAPIAAPARHVEPEDPRVTMLKGLLQAIPSGYFAVEEAEGMHTDFIRISRPRPGGAHKKFAGAVKIQSQHGDSLALRAAYWPETGYFRIFQSHVAGHGILDALMLLVTDYQGAAIRYGRRIGKCCRCNAHLTDDESRHYTIGPECKNYWPWVHETIDEMDAAARA